MPFASEFLYLYLYLKEHLAKYHRIECVRGDTEYLTLPIIEKVKNDIQKADFIIADCTGGRPNVYYEIGIAHTLSKKIIFITKDEINQESLPFDVSQFEFIYYGDRTADAFLKRLDNGIDNVLSPQYTNLYNQAKVIFREFKKTKKLKIHEVSEAVFRERIKSLEYSSAETEAEIAYQVLYALIAEIYDVNVGRQITEWLSSRYPTD